MSKTEQEARIAQVQSGLSAFQKGGTAPTCKNSQDGYTRPHANSSMQMKTQRQIRRAVERTRVPRVRRSEDLIDDMAAIFVALVSASPIPPYLPEPKNFQQHNDPFLYSMTPSAASEGLGAEAFRMNISERCGFGEKLACSGSQRLMSKDSSSLHAADGYVTSSRRMYKLTAGFAAREQQIPSVLVLATALSRQSY